MLSQREADLGVLISLYGRSQIRISASKLYRIKNSLTAGGYLTLAQFDDALGTLFRLQMAEIEGFDDEQLLRITAHGRTWLMSNFHWVQGDRATLEPNGEAWAMTPPDNDTQTAK